MKQKWETFCWGSRIAFQINGRSLILWLIFTVVLSLLPAVSLGFQREITSAISVFLAEGTDTWPDVWLNVLFYGGVLTLIALSARFNDDVLYMIMFDDFYLGLEDVMMTASQKVPLSRLMEKQTSDDYFAAISRCGALTDLTSSGCVLIGKIVSIISLLIVSSRVSILITLFAAVYLVLAWILNSRFAKRTQVVWSVLRRDMRRADYLEKLIREKDPAKETRLYDSMDMIVHEWRRAYSKVEKLNLDSIKGQALLKVLLKTGLYIFMLFVMLWSCIQVANGYITPALVLMMFTFCLNFAEAVGAIPKSYQALSYGLYGLSIQKDFFDRKWEEDTESEDIIENTGELENNVIFEAKDLSFSYPGGKPVFEHINFRIYKGESIALVGANGTGKSTLIRLLLGLYKPTGGTLLYKGHPYTPEICRMLAENTGSFFQDFYLFHLTVAENVGAGDVAHIDDLDRVRQAIHEGGAESIVERLPQKLNNRIGVQVYKDGAELSGGERQRIAVSRAFMSDKEVLVFDEPASMLDPVAELKQFENIHKKVRNHTSILVSHRIGFARLADRIFVLDQGRLAETGTHESLLAQNGIYAGLYYEQSQWYHQTEGDIKS